RDIHVTGVQTCALPIFDPAELVTPRFGLEPALGTEHDERTLGRVADQPGGAVLVTQMGVVAQHPGDQGGPQRRELLAVEHAAVETGRASCRARRATWVR